MALTSKFLYCCVVKVETESVRSVVNHSCHLVKGLVLTAEHPFLLRSVAVRKFEGDADMLLYLMYKHLKYGL